MKKILLAFLLAALFSGCWTMVGVREESVTVTYTYGYGYYYGWYDFYYPYYIYRPYYPRPYILPNRIHVPSFYDKHPQYKTRNSGNTRSSGVRTTPTPTPQPKANKPTRQQGTRRQK